MAHNRIMANPNINFVVSDDPPRLIMLPKLSPAFAEYRAKTFLYGTYLIQLTLFYIIITQRGPSQQPSYAEQWIHLDKRVRARVFNNLRTDFN